MPLVNKYINADYAIGIWRIDEDLTWLEKQVSTYTTASPPYSNFKNDQRRKEWLAVRVLKDAMGCNDEIIYDGRKPSLSNTSLYISIAHTRKYVAIVLSKTNGIGIDIEFRSPRAFKIRTAFMNDDEVQNTEAAKAQETTATLIWSAKESIYKAMPEGCYDFKKHYKTSHINNDQTGTFTITENCTKQKATYNINYAITSEYVLTFAKKDNK